MNHSQEATGFLETGFVVVASLIATVASWFTQPGLLVNTTWLPGKLSKPGVASSPLSFEPSM